ncbi:MAG: roadblock/LC7 domain-containing protein [Saccharopolyspora sp.]|uniref:roadblock/LC7 domain-containing protein n=1 Tax=Saccharopolyspora TaxID=1835 RepID=UPI00190E3893|nr:MULTISPECIES: roadblock/LC7 domain-containing protein [unclassified Saccharopolyspora]MBK0870260.1 roadblock/LC7 domain-containing protein [Saccharopolyspora sp. HNM0986]MBQ6642514.1 roadblock/LC7 domain-containing protein [Saccharopolyspora sp.]
MSETARRAALPDRTWVLDDLVEHAGIRAAIAVSGDGMLLVKNAALDRADAERWAAVSAPLQSCARHGMEPLGYPTGGFEQVMVQHARGFQLLQPFGEESYLVLVTEADADLGVVATEMQATAQRLGQEMGTAARTAAGNRP